MTQLIARALAERMLTPAKRFAVLSTTEQLTSLARSLRATAPSSWAASCVVPQEPFVIRQFSTTESPAAMTFMPMGR